MGTGIGDSQCKGPVAGDCWARSWNIRRASVRGEEGEGVREGWEAKSYKALKAVIRSVVLF